MIKIISILFSMLMIPIVSGCCQAQVVRKPTIITPPPVEKEENINVVTAVIGEKYYSQYNMMESMLENNTVVETIYIPDDCRIVVTFPDDVVVEINWYSTMQQVVGKIKYAGILDYSYYQQELAKVLSSSNVPWQQYLKDIKSRRDLNVSDREDRQHRTMRGN